MVRLINVSLIIWKLKKFAKYGAKQWRAAILPSCTDTPRHITQEQLAEYSASIFMLTNHVYDDLKVFHFPFIHDFVFVYNLCLLLNNTLYRDLYFFSEDPGS